MKFEINQIWPIALQAPIRHPPGIAVHSRQSAALVVCRELRQFYREALMKERHHLCLLLMVFFVLCIPVLGAEPRQGSVTKHVCGSLTATPRSLNSGGAAGGESTLIIDNWNPSGCSFTDKAVMNLTRPAYVESVQLWYNWAAGESSLPYTLTAGGGVLRQGQFRRGSCDPYQSAWCEATDSIGMNLAPGSYTFTVARACVSKLRQQWYGLHPCSGDVCTPR
jgi:hypothetical protein